MVSSNGGLSSIGGLWPCPGLVASSKLWSVHLHHSSLGDLNLGPAAASAKTKYQGFEGPIALKKVGGPLGWHWIKIMEVSVEVNVSPWRLMLLKCTVTMSSTSMYKDFPAKYATTLRVFASGNKLLVEKYRSNLRIQWFRMLHFCDLQLGLAIWAMRCGLWSQKAFNIWNGRQKNIK